MMTSDNSPQPESKSDHIFASVFSVDNLRERPTRIVLKADAAQATALADLNGIIAVNALTATFDIARSGRTGVKVSGEIVARVTQTCGVTLEPFEADVRETFELKYAPAVKPHIGARPRKGNYMKEAQDYSDRQDISARVVEHHMNEEDPPEDMIDGKIDLGALVAEFFALGLDPYPRKPDADLASVAAGIPNLELDAPVGIVEKVSPFSALVNLKPDVKSEG